MLKLEDCPLRFCLFQEISKEGEIIKKQIFDYQRRFTKTEKSIQNKEIKKILTRCNHPYESKLASQIKNYFWKTRFENEFIFLMLLNQNTCWNSDFYNMYLQINNIVKLNARQFQANPDTQNTFRVGSN